MTSLRFSVSLLALALISGCNFDLDSIPSIEDCENAGLTNCGDNGGSGAVGGSGSGGGGASGSGGISGSGGVGGTGGISGSGGVGGTGGISGSGGVGIGGAGGGAATTCGGATCPVLATNPLVQVQPCCTDNDTCGASEVGSNFCSDVFDPGPDSAACPSEPIQTNLGPTLMGIGCCRTDGRCGLNGSLFGVGCVAREEMPFSLGGPRPMIACGTIVRQPCLATSDCGSGHVCGNIDFNTGESFCVPSNPTGQQTGEQCTQPMSSGECESGLCFANTLECSTACNGPWDCDNINGQPACAGFLAGNGARFNICGTACRGQGWCRPDQVCGIASDAETDETIGMCAARNPPGVILRMNGEPCGSDAECASSLCLYSPTVSQNVCSSVCESSNDCTTGFPLPRQCVAINQLGIGLFGNISVCQ